MLLSPGERHLFAGKPVVVVKSVGGDDYIFRDHTGRQIVVSTRNHSFSRLAQKAVAEKEAKKEDEQDELESDEQDELESDEQ